MIRQIASALVALTASVAIVGCGGGGGDGGGTPPASTPPTSGTPTATLSASPAAADDLVSAAQSGANSLVSASSIGGIPIAVLLSPPSGIIIDETDVCPYGGTFHLTGNLARDDGIPSAGDTMTFAVTNCSFAPGAVSNGSVAIEFSRYNSESDFAVDVVVTGFSYAASGTTYGPVSFTAHFDVFGGVVSYSYSIDGHTIVGSPAVSVTGTDVTISSGTVHAEYASGWVRVVYSNWRYNSATGIPTSGTITVTASNGNSAVITVTSSGYNVSITVDGATTNYLVPFS